MLFATSISHPNVVSRNCCLLAVFCCSAHHACPAASLSLCWPTCETPTSTHVTRISPAAVLFCCVQVTVFHISTITISQRSALARTWLADNSMTEGADEGQDDTTGDDQQAGDSSDSDSGSDSGGMPPDLLETWAVLVRGDAAS
jgi:hypothetical protein